MQLSKDIKPTLFNSFWRAGDGFTLAYHTPFFRGHISGGLAYTPYHGKTKNRPDYQSYFISLGWFYNIQLPCKFKIAPGLRFGNYLMNFDIESDDNKFESEIAYEIFSSLEKPLSDHININFEISRTTIFIYETLVFNHFKAGFTFHLDDTGWLKDILE